MNCKFDQNKVRFAEINDNNLEQRIDNYLLRELTGVPKTHIYKIIRKGEVRVNKKRIKPTYKLQIGDIVRIPPIRTAQKMEVKVEQPLITFLESAVLFENNQILVINKPSGLAVHGGSGVSYGLIEAVRKMRPQEKFLELVHRLDRDTSGCILIAKKKQVLTALHTQLRERSSDKRYIALLCGNWHGKQRIVDVPLRKNTLKSGERVVNIDPQQGKDSRSIYTPIKNYSDASLVEIKIETGRTHQIRVHSQYLKKPIVGDQKYGNFACNQRFKKLGLKRLFLHSSQITIHLPNSSRAHTFKAPLAEDLQKIIDKLDEPQ